MLEDDDDNNNNNLSHGLITALNVPNMKAIKIKLEKQKRRRKGRKGSRKSNTILCFMYTLSGFNLQCNP